MARAIRTRAGRLRQGERRRRLRAAALAPGEIILLDTTRARRKGTRLRNSISLEFASTVQWAADLDIRKFIAMWRLALAEYFSASLLHGQRPDGSGPLPQLERESERNRSYAVKTGFMAANWNIHRITGGPFRARTVVKPNGAGQRADVIRRALADGVDFQAVTGPAADITREVLRQWLAMAVGTVDGVATPERVTTEGGTLPQVRSRSR